ncbi:MAG: type VI secretion system protein TssA [Isosphaeraceae bacterium]|nr:type VI secretion system protein TssA [Isosphaeraceae bacterium]
MTPRGPTAMRYDPLDLVKLLAPISEAEPAGTAAVHEVLDRLRSDRKAITVLIAEDAATPRDAEWNRIVELATETLETRSKHLQVAVRLVEAISRRDGFIGLSSGLRMLRGLVEQCWDRMYPELDPSDPSVRADPFEYLNDGNAGALLPVFVRAMPMVAGEEEEYSWADINAKAPTSTDAKVVEAHTAREKKIKQAIELSKRDGFDAIAAALKSGLEDLAGLVAALNDKIGRNDAPGMTNLRDAMEDCLRQVHSILKDKGGINPPQADGGESGEPAEAEAAGEAVVEASSGGGGGPARKAVITRADVYRRLAESAELLEKMEPHSPIPYMIKRAVSLGSLPFPQLMKALLSDAKALDELHKGLGIGDEAK